MIPLVFDVAEPPAVHGELLDFGGGLVLEAAPAIVLTLADGTNPPPGAVSLGGRSWRVPANDVVRETSALLARPGVVSAFPDVRLPRRPLATFDDPERGGQWYLDLLGMDALFDRSLGDPDVRVAVIDSGIDVAHPDLSAAFDAPFDAHDGDDDPSPNPGEYCGSGGGICDEHGTAVSGIIGARANNAEGIVGLCPDCRIVPIKLLGEDAGLLSADVAAFEHATDSGAAVINNSWGFVESIPVPEPLALAIRRAATEGRGGLGAVVVFAAGNDDREIVDNEMESMPEVLCVGATDRYGLPTAYTNFGGPLDVAAPSATFSTVPGGYTTTFGGTSAAAPVVSGLAGWIVSVAPELTDDEVRALLVETAVKSPQVTFDASGHHDVYGYGEISPANVLAELFPEEIGACGCAHRGPSGGYAAALALLALARRSRPR